MDEARIKTLVVMTGQYLRREYPLETSGLTATIAEKLEQVRLADDRARADRAARGKISKRTSDRQ
jgi:hypothetical protein